MYQFFKKLMLLILLIIIGGFCSPEITSANSVNIPLRDQIDDKFSGIPLRGGVKIDHKEQVVTLSLRESDLRQVLRMLADKAGLNLIMHESVGGNITLDLVDVELNRVFEYILTMKNLTYNKDGNTLIIAESDSANELGLNVSAIKSIKIKYTEAQKIANFLNKNIFSVNRPNTSTASIVTTNPSTNEILVFGSDDDIQLAEKVVNYLDMKPQIKNYEINFADPVALASKICWTVFKSSEGESDLTSEAGLSEGSETKLVCGNTAGPINESESDMLEDFSISSYWVLADSGLNQITIYGGTSEQLVMAEEIVKNFDKREPQVYLEVSVIELSESDVKDLEFHYMMDRTVDGQATPGSFLSFIGGTFQVQGIRDLLKGDQTYIYDSAPTDGQNLPLMQTLLTETKARLLANPRIITANNVGASINISEDVIQSVTSTTTDTGLVTQEVTIGPGDAISFSILPKISPNGFVTISIPDFTLSAFKGTSEAGGTAAGLTASRTVEVKEVRVKDGDTLVIGGLIQEREQIEREKFPILSDIPIIGTIFQQQKTNKVRTEIIIMITPRILKDADEVEPV